MSVDFAVVKFARQLQGNRSQFDINRNKVTTCRPDVQWNSLLGGFRSNEEVIFSADWSRTLAKGIVMQRADQHPSVFIMLAAGKGGK